MNDYIVTVNYFPLIWGKDKVFRVKTKLSKDDIYNKIKSEELDENLGFDIYVDVETIDEYLEDIEIKEIK